MPSPQTLCRGLGLAALITVLVGCVPSGGGAPSEAPKRSAGTGINAILVGDARGRYQANTRNVRGSDVFRIVEHAGKTAARFSLGLSDGGHPGDWTRNGRPGYGQRVEFGESNSGAQKLGRDYWTHMSLYIPRGTRSRDMLSLFDLKEVIDGRTRGKLHGLAIRQDAGLVGLKFGHVMNEPWRCANVKDASGQQNAECEGHDVSVILGPVDQFAGRWIDIVTLANWNNDGTGEYHLWVDGRKMMGLRGAASQGADAIRFKFGMYRIGLNEGLLQDRVTLYYADVGTARQCEDVVPAGCESLRAQRGVLGYPNARSTFTYRGNANRIADRLAEGWQLDN